MANDEPGGNHAVQLNLTIQELDQLGRALKLLRNARRYAIKELESESGDMEQSVMKLLAKVEAVQDSR